MALEGLYAIWGCDEYGNEVNGEGVMIAIDINPFAGTAIADERVVL